MSEEKAGQHTLVTFLLDRTGAADAVRDQTINAFNAYLETLKAGGERIKFTLIQFDRDSFDPVHVCTPVREVPYLKPKTYVPRGPVPRRRGGIPSVIAVVARSQIPLIDATCNTIMMVSELLEQQDNKPKVVICIQASGVEGTSTEHTWEELSLLIKARTTQGWQINFLSGGISVYEQGVLMSMPLSHVVKYIRDATGQMRKAFVATAEKTVALVRGELDNTGFSAQQKYDIGDRFAPRGENRIVLR